MMKSFLLTAALLVLAGPLFAQETILDRLSKLENRLASMEAQQKAGQDEIRGALKEIKDAIKPTATVSAPTGVGVCPVGHCGPAGGCGINGCTMTSAEYCGLKGCGPQQSRQDVYADQGDCSSSGDLFSRIRERRAARRGY